MTDKLKELIREKLLGPGYAKDVICCKEDASDEILNEAPKFVYYTGILSNNATPELENDNSNEDDELDVAQDNVNIPEQEDDDDDGKENNSDEENVRKWTSSDTVGLITCVKQDVKEIDVTISYAKYKKISTKSIHTVKIKANDEFDEVKRIIELLTSNESVNEWLGRHTITESFKSFFVFNKNDRTFSLNDNSERLFLRNSENDETIYKVISRIFGNESDDNGVRFNSGTYNNATNLIRILLKGVFYKRIPRKKELIINIDEEPQPIQINGGKIYLHRKIFNANGRKYVKILVRNESSLYYYQTEILVKSSSLVPYTDPIETDFDSEATLNEYIYRNVKNYGKGIGCAVKWDEKGQWIQTTYMPECKVSSFSQKLEDDTINQVCTLRNISTWSEWDDEEILSKLTNFVDGYETWCTEQQKLAGNDDVAKEILQKQEQLRDRLYDNITYMQDNPDALECFKVANTAMLVQMVISRDRNFEKNRDTVEGNMFNRLDYFQNGEYIKTMPDTREPAYRPFQLAFLLMNVKSTFENNDPDRTQNVDLIWFPTGGGKTEAYLALTALTIIKRRRSNDNDRGVSVIMRYTLRLLTSQQFERASLLICSLEFLRRKNANFQLGNVPITIGLWIGNASTPNRIDELSNGNYGRFRNGDNVNNPFPVSYCPWCGKRMNPDDYAGDGGLLCGNAECCFNEQLVVIPGIGCGQALTRCLPIDYIDEQIYRIKPTLLFATVDKFAQLYRNAPNANAAGLMANSPDLIIQDELHLISGPLGSTVGLFETVVEKMAKQHGVTPKIIASTATTRNTEQLIKSLYGNNRNVNIFPPQGVEYNDNYFSHIENEARRTHIGLMPTGSRTSNEMEIELTAHLILTRIKLIADRMKESGVDLTDNDKIITFICEQNDVKKEFDNIWSVVMYYNSLKDLGRSRSIVSQEVKSYVNTEKRFYQIPHSLFFLFESFDNRTQEFTSREESTRIKELLTLAQSRTRISNNDERLNIESGIDLVFASNMISVGIDIARWNIMLMMGQPRSTSEYIQSSSRIARSEPGLVFSLFNPIRVREYSLFENYTSFHAAYYKYVEPLSATPLNTEMLRLDLWNNIVRCFENLPNNNQLAAEQRENIILDALKERFVIDEILEEKIRRRIQEIEANGGNYAQSLRDIAPNCYTKINDLTYN